MPDDATSEVWKWHPNFAEEEAQDDDGPLPFELKRRIVEYLEREHRDPESFKGRIENESSFNSLVRKEIRAGNL